MSNNDSKWSESTTGPKVLEAVRTLEKIQYRVKGAAWLAFAAGIVLATGTRMFHQDLVGLETYVEMTRRGWIDLPWWVGLTVQLAAIGGLMLALSVIERETRP